MVLRGLAIAAICCTMIFPAVGAAEPPIASSVVFPIINPRLSSTFGARQHPIRHTKRHHNGIDLAAPENSHVRAIAAGRVIYADHYSGFGKLVTIDHGRGYISMYGHLSEIRANIGDQIKAGAIIGRVGSTGLATGPHLHFEWRINGKPLDPLKAFPFFTAEAEG